MALSLSGFGSLLSKFAAIVAELAPLIESMEPAQAEKFTAAGVTMIATLAGAVAPTAASPTAL